MAQLDTLSVKGFKSIKELIDFPLENINIIIGANGSGKSNFLDIFKFLRATMQLPLPGFFDTNLKKYVLDFGTSRDFIYNGPVASDEIEFEMKFGINGYRIFFKPTQDDLLRIDREYTYYNSDRFINDRWKELSSSSDGFTPTLIKDSKNSGVRAQHGVSFYVFDSIDKWQMYHFHDTGKNAPVKSTTTILDNEYLRFDCSNLASYLYKLKDNDPSIYEKIVKVIQLIAPYFDDFYLSPDKNENIRLLWKQKKIDIPMKPQSLSDGTLRFICLATVLLQPNHPETIIIDEPELGLHPQAIAMLSELIKARSEDTQIIIATQSPELISNFDPQDIIIADRKDGQSTFSRLDETEFDNWLEDYTLGELWKNNILSGGPKYE